MTDLADFLDREPLSKKDTDDLKRWIQEMSRVKISEAVEHLERRGVQDAEKKIMDLVGKVIYTPRKGWLAVI